VWGGCGGGGGWFEHSSSSVATGRVIQDGQISAEEPYRDCPSRRS